MADANNPDGIVTYRLNESVSGSKGRIYEYAQNPGAAQFSGGNGKISFSGGTNGQPNIVTVRNGTAANPVYLGIRILESNGVGYLTPVAIQLRRQAASRGNGNPQGRGTFPEAIPVAASGNGAAMLVLVDNEDDKANFEFDVLFTDGSGNFGLLDPKLENI